MNPFSLVGLASSAIRGLNAASGPSEVSSVRGSAETGKTEATKHVRTGPQAGEGALMQDVMLTLNQMGMGANLQPLNLNGAKPGDAGSSSGSSASGIDPKQAMHAFMHDLFQITQPNGGARSAGHAGGGEHHGGAGKAGQYDNFANGLQSIVDSLKADADGSTINKDALAKLQTDFNNLTQALGGASGNAAAANVSAASLTDFLQNLQKNMAQHARSPSPVGNGVAVSA